MMLVLRDFLDSYTSKLLAQVDLPHGGSHQHELNGSAPLRRLLGTERIEGKIQWLHLADNEDPVRTEGSFTFYDARAKSASRTGRSEWRFYYDTSVLHRARSGDLLVLLRLKDSPVTELSGLLFPAGTTWFAQAKLIFESSESAFLFAGESELDEKKIGFAEHYILDLLGVQTSKISPNVEEIVDKFLPDQLLTTKGMAALVHTLCPISQSDVSDDVLVEWLSLEEQIFRAWERRVVERRLATGFSDVNDFVSFSLSVQNRRKSRMGYSLENHIEKLLQVNSIRYSTKAITENGNEPDFLFPSAEEYNDPQFPEQWLTMLAAKSTLKDRWRQVLIEADRIAEKHLCTLEPAITVQQTRQIAQKGVRLVIPKPIHSTYTLDQQAGLTSVEEFLHLVKDRQTRVQQG